jgi:hypothetical protein
MKRMGNERGFQLLRFKVVMRRVDLGTAFGDQRRDVSSSSLHGGLPSSIHVFANFRPSN